MIPTSALALLLFGSWLVLANGATPSASAPVNLPAPQDGVAAKVLPTPIPAPPTSASQSVPFTNATLARDILLELSKTGPWSEPANLVDVRDYPAWRQRFPNLGLSGYSVAADPRHVSVYRDRLDPRQPASDANPTLIAFTVSDMSGRCAAGVLMGFPTYTTFGAVDIGSAKCKAQSVLDRLR